MKLCLIWGVLLLTLCGPAVAQQASKPDVILITLDTVRVDHVGCFGAKQVKTPSLDQLCADGVRFTNAFTPSPITNSSHASILTGTYPSTNGVRDFGSPLDSAHPTLAYLLKARGYSTAAFISAVILDSKTLAPGFDSGFNLYWDFPAQSSSTSRWGRVERRAEATVAEASKWLEQSKGPRFLWVHLYDAHDPYEPPEPYASEYKGDEYDGEIAYADHELGRLLSLLKLKKIYDGALIIAVADHGEGLGEHKENTHGIFLYDSTLHVPLIIKLPGNAQHGTAIDTQVRTIDIVPTVMDEVEAGSTAAETAKFDGSSLASMLSGAKGDDHVALGETDYPLRFGWAPLRSVRMDAKKYIEAPRPEFYLLDQDPKELDNRYASSTAEAQKLRAALAPVENNALARSSAPLGKDSKELSALGYAPAVGSSGRDKALPDPKDKIEIQNLVHAGMMATDSNDATAALEYFRKAVALDPESQIALRQLGELELSSGDYAAAAKHLAAAHRLLPDDGTLSLKLAQALQKTGDLEGTRLALEEALKSLPGQYDARVTLGQIYLRKNDLAAAQDQLEAAILLDDSRPEARIALARVLMASNQPAKAESELKKVLKDRPDNQEARKLLTSIQQKR
jgi:arylsulfatase A-like enzyme/Tfp pilus assembly protein PilF